MNELFSYLLNQPDSVLPAVAAIFGGGTVVSVLLQGVKHKFDLHESKGFVIFLLTGLSFLTAFADYLISSQTGKEPLPFLGKYSGDIMAAAVIIHRIAVSPLYSKVQASLAQKAQERADAEAYRTLTAPQSVAPVEIPAIETFQV